MARCKHDWVEPFDLHSAPTHCRKCGVLKSGEGNIANLRPGERINPPRRQPRRVDDALLVEFEEWTRTAPMFLTSPEGATFGEEMREVIRLARKGLM